MSRISVNYLFGRKIILLICLIGILLTGASLLYVRTWPSYSFCPLEGNDIGPRLLVDPNWCEMRGFPLGYYGKNLCIPQDRPEDIKVFRCKHYNSDFRVLSLFANVVLWVAICAGGFMITNALSSVFAKNRVDTKKKFHYKNLFLLTCALTLLTAPVVVVGYFLGWNEYNSGGGVVWSVKYGLTGLLVLELFVMIFTYTNGVKK